MKIQNYFFKKLFKSYSKKILKQKYKQIHIVLYYEDQCTKNKCMFWIPTHGLFLTCTETLSNSAHTYKKSSGCIFAKKENILLRKAIPCSWWQIPHPHRSLVWSQLLVRPLHFPHPLHPLPSNRAFTVFYTKATVTSPIFLPGTDDNKNGRPKNFNKIFYI
jgi:hypothetical protein